MSDCLGSLQGKKRCLELRPRHIVKAGEEILDLAGCSRNIVDTGVEFHPVASRKHGNLFNARQRAEAQNALFEFVPAECQPLTDVNAGCFVVNAENEYLHTNACRPLRRRLTPKKVKSTAKKPTTESSAALLPLHPAISRT